MLFFFNPYNNNLFDSDSRLIKQLHCPVKADWEEMAPGDCGVAKVCYQCKRKVHDIRDMNPGQVAELVKNDPQVCLKLELNYPNVRMQYEEIEA